MILIGERIRKLRERDNLLLGELASEINIDQALLSKIERRENIPTKKQIISIVNYFNVDQDEFLTQWWAEIFANEIKSEIRLHYGK